MQALVLRGEFPLGPCNADTSYPTSHGSSQRWTRVTHGLFQEPKLRFLSTRQIRIPAELEISQRMMWSSLQKEIAAAANKIRGNVFLAMISGGGCVSGANYLQLVRRAYLYVVIH